MIGRETKEQSIAAFDRLPDCVVACVGGGSNAAGMFYPFIEEAGVRLVGIEAARSRHAPGDHASPLTLANPVCCTAVTAM